jgi:hypothetical protein
VIYFNVGDRAQQRRPHIGLVGRGRRPGTVPWPARGVEQAADQSAAVLLGEPPDDLSVLPAVLGSSLQALVRLSSSTDWRPTSCSNSVMPACSGLLLRMDECRQAAQGCVLLGRK